MSRKIHLSHATPASKNNQSCVRCASSSCSSSASTNTMPSSGDSIPSLRPGGDNRDAFDRPVNQNRRPRPDRPSPIDEMLEIFFPELRRNQQQPSNESRDSPPESNPASWIHVDIDLYKPASTLQFFFNVACQTILLGISTGMVLSLYHRYNASIVATERSTRGDSTPDQDSTSISVQARTFCLTCYNHVRNGLQQSKLLDWVSGGNRKPWYRLTIHDCLPPLSGEKLKSRDNESDVPAMKEGTESESASAGLLLAVRDVSRFALEQVPVWCYGTAFSVFWCTVKGVNVKIATTGTGVCHDRGVDGSGPQSGRNVPEHQRQRQTHHLHEESYLPHHRHAFLQNVALHTILCTAHLRLAWYLLKNHSPPPPPAVSGVKRDCDEAVGAVDTTENASTPRMKTAKRVGISGRTELPHERSGEGPSSRTENVEENTSLPLPRSAATTATSDLRFPNQIEAASGTLHPSPSFSALNSASPPVPVSQSLTQPQRYMELMVHNVSHTDFVYGLTVDEGPDIKNNFYLARPRFSYFDEYSRRVKQAWDDEKQSKDTAGECNNIICFPGYERSY
jgi:hypothetical protein